MEVTIEKLVYGGDGLARIEGPDGRRKTVFVPLVLPGERADVTIVNERHGFARARVDRIVTSAKERTEPSCTYFGQCGGCHYQHATYNDQLQFKSQILRETVARIAKIELPEIQVHASPPLHYRNRTRIKIERSANGVDQFAIGYYRLGSHSLLPVSECPISSPLINRALHALWSLAAAYPLPAGLAEIELFADSHDSSLLIEFLTGQNPSEAQLREFARQLRTALPQIVGVVALPRSRESQETIAAPELEAPSSGKPFMLAGSANLQYKVNDFAYRVSAGSFFQSNRFLTPALLELASSNVSGKLALDLYAGAGLFTLPLAQTFERVVAVEAAPASFRDLVANAPPNVKTIESTTEAFLSRFRGTKPDFVIVDPPRSGLGQRVVISLTKLSPKQLTYISCDPSTLARDLPAFIHAGYRISQAHLVDLFPQTFHIETVLRLER